MGVDKTQIGLIITSPRATRERQLNAVRNAGASWIVSIPADIPSWRAITGEIEPGHRLYIFALALLPTKRGADKLSPTAQITEFMVDLHERGGTLFEAYTGLDSANPRQRRAMIAEAHNSIRRGQRELPAILPPGRPRIEWPSAEAEAEARRIWASRDYTTRAAAIRHMPAGVTTSLIRQLGPRGSLLRRKRRR
jgi:hypothetical protein